MGLYLYREGVKTRIWGISEVEPSHRRVPGGGGQGGRQVLQRRGDQQDGLHLRQSAGAGQDDDSDA